jgi:hypothetical protein
MVVMTVVVMMGCGGKGWGSEHENQEHGSKHLLHEVNLA